PSNAASIPFCPARNPMLLRSLTIFVVLTLASAPAWADIDAYRMLKAAQRPLTTTLPPAALAPAGGRVPVMVRLPRGTAAADLGLLEVAPGIGAARWTPDQVTRFSESHPRMHPFTAPPRRSLVNVSGQWTRAPIVQEDFGLDGAGVVVGIIDTGIDAAHPDFRHADGTTRVAWMFLSGEPAGLQPELEASYGCTDPDQSPCLIVDGAQIDELLANPDLLPPDDDGHGTHVTSIAVGDGRPMGDDDAFVGVAPGATIITASPSATGSFSDPDILRAAQFVFERAEQMGMPAVVNISLGSDFGPHDGSSLLEEGLAALIGPEHPGRVIVVAAGNSGALYRLGQEGPLGVHTEAHVSSNAVTRAPLRVAGISGQVSGAGFVWVHFKPGDDVEVSLEGPNGEVWVDFTSPGEERGYDEGGTIAAVINNVSEGNTFLGPNTNGAVVFWEGEWNAEDALAIRLRGDGDAKLWTVGTGGANGGLGLLFERAVRQGTVAVPASAPELISVGCTVNRTSWVPHGSFVPIELEQFGPQRPPIVDSTCFFSASGPNANGQIKPDVVAPGAFVAGAVSRGADPQSNSNSFFLVPGCPNDDPCYLVSPRHGLTSGTSMSSPHVAGAAAILLQRNPELTQNEVREIIQAGASRPTGEVPYDFQMGPGALNIEGALQVLDERFSRRPVDADASWYSVGGAYLQPVAGRTVPVVVELRDGDGAVIDGIDPSSIRVAVEGAVLAEGPVLVRAGLYRFTLAAEPGTGGTLAEVEVFAQGRSLGRREVPVGLDSFSANGAIRPVGGCATAPPGSGGGASWTWLLGLGLLGYARRRT
ncbi:MAG: S8 family serine peptidase, partial [Myxococcota bacterium]